MTTFKFRLASLSIFTILSLLLGQVGATQTNLDNPSLILFNRRGSRTESIIVLNVNTGEETRLTNEDLFYARNWSPDGNRILVLQPNANPFFASTFVVIDADGQNRQQLTDPDKLDPYFWGYWSPDSNLIFFWGRDLVADAGQPSWAIYSVPANGGLTRRLIEPTSSLGGLTLSPDGSQIIFRQDSMLYSMSSDGGTPQVINDSFNRSSIIEWSPDGSQIAMVTSRADRKLGIYVFEPDGSNVRLLVTDMGDIHSIEWSPDSSELLFRAYAGGGWGALTLGIVNVETGAIDTYNVGEGVLESLSTITHAIWSPDGAQIVLSGFYTDNNPYNFYKNLYLVDRNFTQIQRLTRIEASDDVMDWRLQMR